MKSFAAADLTRNAGDLFQAATVAPVTITKHRKPRFVVMSLEQYETLLQNGNSQRAVSVTQMPDDLGALFDKGVEDHLNDK